MHHSKPSIEPLQETHIEKKNKVRAIAIAIILNEHILFLRFNPIVKKKCNDLDPLLVELRYKSGLAKGFGSKGVTNIADPSCAKMIPRW